MLLELLDKRLAHSPTATHAEDSRGVEAVEAVELELTVSEAKVLVGIDEADEEKVDVVLELESNDCEPDDDPDWAAGSSVVEDADEAVLETPELAGSVMVAAGVASLMTLGAVSLVVGKSLVGLARTF